MRERDTTTRADAPGDELNLLVATEISKHYGGVQALDDAWLKVRAGEVHGLIGENGSGKSTLLKIFCGQVAPDRASITLGGDPMPIGNPVRSLAAGIATVTQETTLVPELTVAENIVLGRRAVRRWWGLDRKASTRRAREVLERLDLRIDPRIPVSRLRPDERQMVEIARAISMDARILILDEPTSSLTDEEVTSLFKVVRGLKEQSVSTIFVSHRLKEIFALTDRITVLRDGSTVGAVETSELDTARLIELMVGRAVEEQSHHTSSGAVTGTRLGVSGLTVPGLIEDISFDVAPGEIIGFAGLVGAGRSELLRALFGLHPASRGSIEVDRRDARSRSPRQAIANGFAFVPADRKEEGLILPMSIRENLELAGSSHKLRLRKPSRRSEAKHLAQTVTSLRVAGARNRGGAAIASLSGGNQQKIVLAKWLAVKPKVIILDEPTRGVDVGAKEEIYGILDGLRSQRAAILVSSSETPELLRLCDRIFVMYRGRIAACFSNSDASESSIAHYATGNN